MVLRLFRMNSALWSCSQKIDYFCIYLDVFITKYPNTCKTVFLHIFISQGQSFSSCFWQKRFLFFFSELYFIHFVWILRILFRNILHFDLGREVFAMGKFHIGCSSTTLKWNLFAFLFFPSYIFLYSRGWSW